MLPKPDVGAGLTDLMGYLTSMQTWRLVGPLTEAVLYLVGALTRLLQDESVGMLQRPICLLQDQI